MGNSDDENLLVADLTDAVVEYCWFLYYLYVVVYAYGARG